MSLYGENIKVPYLVKILDNAELNCDQKLIELKKLVGLNTDDDEEIGTTTSTNNFKALYPKILKSLTTNQDKKIGESFLDEILKSDVISFDPDSLEVIIHGQVLPNTFLPFLIQKIVVERALTHPLGFISFISGLVEMNISPTYIRDNDSKNLFEKIKELKQSISSDNSRNSLNPVPETNIPKTVPQLLHIPENLPQQVVSETKRDDKKRKAEEDETEPLLIQNISGGPRSKRLKSKLIKKGWGQVIPPADF